jgi:hypothetical protein
MTSLLPMKNQFSLDLEHISLSLEILLLLLILPMLQIEIAKTLVVMKEKRLYMKSVYKI